MRVLNLAVLAAIVAIYSISKILFGRCIAINKPTKDEVVSVFVGFAFAEADSPMFRVVTDASVFPCHG